MNLSELKEKTKRLFGKNKKLTAQAFEEYTDAIGNLDALQDTGWIDIRVSPYVVDGTPVRVRRIGDTVTIDVGDMLLGTVTVKDNGWWMQKDSSGQDYYATLIVSSGGIPEGFRPSRALVGSIYADGPESAGTWQLFSSVGSRLALKIRNKRPSNAGIQLPQFRYFTDDPFPKIENGKVVN